MLHKKLANSIVISLVLCLPINHIEADLASDCMSLEAWRAPVMFRGRCFALIGLNPALILPFDQAEAVCTTFPNGHLAIINSVELINTLEPVWLPHGYGRAWISMRRQTPSVSAWPTAGSDDGWYFRYKGQLYGPAPLKNQGWTNFWYDTITPLIIGVECMTFRTTSGITPGYWDYDCTTPEWSLCEYRQAESSFHLLPAMNDQRVVQAAMFRNLSAPHVLRCIKECAENWVCGSFGYNEATKDCRLAMIYENEDAALYETAPGYTFYTRD